MRTAAIAKTTALGAALVAVPLMGALPAAAQEEDSSRLSVISYELAQGANAGKIATGAPLAMTADEASGGVNLGFRVTNLDGVALENVNLSVSGPDGQPAVKSLQCKVTSASGATGVDGAIGTLEPASSVECTGTLVDLSAPSTSVTTQVSADVEEGTLLRSVTWTALVTEDGKVPESYEGSELETVSEAVDARMGTPGAPDATVGATASPTPDTAITIEKPATEKPIRGVVAGTTQDEMRANLIAGGIGALVVGGVGLLWLRRRRGARQQG